MPPLPFKSLADRRHHIPKQRHRVTNWAAYDAGLRGRGSLTIWFTEAAIATWRAEPLALPRLQPDTAAVHLLVDSTGLRLCGPGEWLVEKHGLKRRRAWRKLHIGTDADTGQIVAAELTSHDIDDGSQVGPLLEQVARPVASFTGDGAYDRD